METNASKYYFDFCCKVYAFVKELFKIKELRCTFDKYLNFKINVMKYQLDELGLAIFPLYQMITIDVICDLLMKQYYFFKNLAIIVPQVYLIHSYQLQ